MSSDTFFVRNNVIYSPWDNIPKLKGIGSTLFEKMRENGDVIAQIDAYTGEKQTYQQLLKKSIRTAITMKKMGVTSNDIIIICSLNHLNVAVPFLAATFLGTKIAFLDPNLNSVITDYHLKHLCPKFIFASTNAVEIMENCLQNTNIDAKLVIFGNSDKHLLFSQFLQSTPEEETFEPYITENLFETAVIHFSSGTTGFPKGICLNHFGLLAQILSTNWPLDPTVVLTCTSSMYWILATIMFISSILYKYTNIVISDLDENWIWNTINKYKVEFLMCHPPKLMQLCNLDNFGPENSLKHIFTGGMPISSENMQKIRQRLNGVVVFVNYGLTEISGIALTLDFHRNPFDLKQLLEKPNTIGRPVKGYTYKVVDPETEELVGPNQIGELRIKTKFQMNGYYKLDSSNEWDSEGFLKTRDLVYYDEDYCFFYIERVLELIHFRSHSVIPTKLEQILLTHPSIESGVVIGRPHSTDGEQPMAIVVLKSSAVGCVTEDEIVKFVEEHVEDEERLRGGVKFVKKMFLTPSGKLNRRRMREYIFRDNL